MKNNEEYRWDTFKQVLDDYQPEFKPQDWDKLKTKLQQEQLVPSWKQMLYRYRKLLGFIAISTVITLCFLLTTKPNNQEQTPQRQVYDLSESIQQSSKKQENKSTEKQHQPTRKLTSAVSNSQEGTPKEKTIPESNKQLSLRPVSKATDSLQFSYEELELIGFHQLESSFSLPRLELDTTSETPTSPNQQASKKRKKRTWKLPEFNFQLNQTSQAYLQFVGPTEVLLSYSPLSKSNYNSQSLNTPSWTLGLRGPLSDKYAIAVDFSYSKINYQPQGLDQPIFVPDSSRTRAELEAKLPTNFQLHDSTSLIHHQLNMLEVSLSLSRTIAQNEKNIFRAEAGLSARIFLKEVYHDLYQAGDSLILFKEEYGAFKHLTIPANLKLGLSWEYKLSNRFWFYCSPSYHMPLRSSGALKQSWSNWQIKTGIVFKLRRE
ncbi:hypothetical protein [Sunxiuqinia elliptica]|uniref:Outer membrane protein beta-barrel domain-containing protein n=1 Tax=Sunxiuqinia elliptica TaxID=655355 RepID=A0A1I2AZY1_9BACT|nr:hypothetical protein [Sunxiuqinia elliptica]SFE49366.1 hypothetical protein SAMN05216283_101273 [Sunxiuqinia elliptica]